MSKGSRRRPSQVPGATVRDNWDQVFKKCEHRRTVYKMSSTKPVCVDCGKILDD